uniref:40S ribosomal protein S15 n=1 Tax=Parastrongyloides trichosuri TaxID=131310 RepID=A0A0N4ZG93_PARTI
MAIRKQEKRTRLGIIRPLCKKETLKKLEKSLKGIHDSQEKMNSFLSELPLQCVIQTTWPVRILQMTSIVVQCALSIIPFVKNYFT